MYDVHDLQSYHDDEFEDGDIYIDIDDNTLEEGINASINKHIPKRETTHNPTNSGFDALIDLAEPFLRDRAKPPIFDGSQTCMLKALVLILQFQVNFNIPNAAITSLMMIIFVFFLPIHLNLISPTQHVELKKHYACSWSMVSTHT